MSKLYKHNKFTEEIFKNPPKEYRGAPFWSWNCKMDKSIADKFVSDMKEMGMGGFHIHPRTGLDTAYLSDEYMELVKYALELAKKEDMLVWLYDEDRWPSGYGGGYVTQNHDYRMRFLSFCPASGKNLKTNFYGSFASTIKSDEYMVLRRFAICIEDGWLKEYRVLKDGECPCANEKEWSAILYVSGDNPWFNNQSYVDTLNKDAIEKFIEVTHEKYKHAIGDEFGKSVLSMFTDEPQFLHKDTLDYSDEEKELTIPFTDKFEQTFVEKYGISLLDNLPQLFWELQDGEISKIRYYYHDHIAETFAQSFADTLGKWCSDNKLMLTGHMMEEPTLSSQTASLSEAMRSYRAFELPGVDILCHRREFSTLKQAQSATHQYGREGVLSELYGVTNWDFDFKGHKLHGDWQAALGVTARVHHLTWSTMKGEAKRDYPATIGYQSPWYKEYNYIEDYFARVNTALTSGKPVVKVGIVHPIESMWLVWGPKDKTHQIRQELEDGFSNIIEWMLYGLIDFDFISESLLPELTNEDNLNIGKMDYDVIIVPNCMTLRKTTVDYLYNYAKSGKSVIFTGKLPSMQNAIHSERVKELVQMCDYVPFSKGALLDAVDKYRVLDIRNDKGARTDNLIYQLREEKDVKFLFISHVKREYDDIPSEENLKIEIDGLWDVDELEALNGNIKSTECEYTNNMTVIRKTMYCHDSLLLRLKPQTTRHINNIEHNQFTCNAVNIPVLMNYELEEPNVYLLDLAEYRFDDGEWNNREEILRIDNMFREKLSYPLRMEAFAQPWASKDDDGGEHKLSLKFKIYSDITTDNVQLAFEDGDNAYVTLNGRMQDTTVTGYYVDKDIKTIKLDKIEAGYNELIVVMPYNKKINIEYMYLLGDFGVNVRGSIAELCRLPEKLTFGDITDQKLPFYGGNVKYSFDITTDKYGDIVIDANKFRSPLLKVEMDNEFVGYIAFSPYRLSIEDVNAGKHKIDITVFGNRFNTFGTLHNCDESTEWYGPDSWRTEKYKFSYEYQLKKMGLLREPNIYLKEKN